MKIPFDIKYKPQIESGEYKVETRDGRKARIIHWDLNCTSPIVAVMDAHIDLPGEIVDVFSVSGMAFDDLESPSDLFIITPEPELSEWEKFISGCLQKHGLLDCGAADRIAKNCSTELLELAKNEILRSGKWIIGNDALRLTYEMGKAEALNDLPRWKKAYAPCFVGPAIMRDEFGFYHASTTKPGCRYITYASLSALPGFKED